jgi:predicted aspartyl protease
MYAFLVYFAARSGESKYMKMFLFFALGVLLHSNGAVAADCTPFEWAPIVAGELTIAQGAVVVRVDIEGVGKRLPLQVDTGSATTLLYGEAASSSLIAEGTRSRRVSVSDWTDSNRTIPISIRAPEGSPGTAVGTLGTDYLGTGFVLDLAHQRICKMAVVSRGSFERWQTFVKVNGSPVVEIQEDGHPIKVLLDTGSSGFTLLSTPRLSTGIASAAPARSLRVPSFGRMLQVGELVPTAAFSMMGRPFKLDVVYSLDDPEIEEMLKSAGIAGLMGLRPFVDGALVFDFPGQRIAFGSMGK